MNEYTSGIDTPAGSYVSIPSAITGKTLSYFTPSPLGELFDRSSPITQKPLHDINRKSPGSALVFLRIAAATDNLVSYDHAQATKLIDVLFSCNPIKDYDRLINLGQSVCPRSTALRDEAAFSAGTAASNANHVYAPHASVPHLLQSLLREIGSKRENIDSVHAAAIVGFFCSHTHPFGDGNGRWSRLLALQEGAKYEDLCSAMCNVAMQRACSHELARRVWPYSRISGLRNYLNLCVAFERAVLSHGAIEEAVKFSVETFDWLKGKSMSMSNRKTALLDLHMSGKWESSRVRAVCSLSHRSVAGYFEKMADSYPNLCHHKNGNLSIDPMNNMVKAIFVTSREQLF